jgi:hypothetical protein
MRIHLPGGGHGGTRASSLARARALARLRALPGTVARAVASKARWLELTVVLAAIAVAAVSLTHVWQAPLLLDPLLAVPPALAAVGAASVWRPFGYGVVALIAAVAVDLSVSGGTFTGAALTVHSPAHALPFATAVAVVVSTAAAATGTVVGLRQGSAEQEQQEQQIANVLSVAETVQRAVLQSPPAQIGPLTLGSVYIAAAAEAKVGGDLYEAISTREHGMRLIIGDVRGKGLGAVEVAADVLGRFREVAHEVHTLGEVARRLDAGLARRYGQHEEFVTALLAEIDLERGWLTIFVCGHPPAILISADSKVSVLEAPSPAPPLGLITLGHSSGAEIGLKFQPGAQLLLYTDGVTEARDRARSFYPLPERVAALAPAAERPRGRGRKARPPVSAANGSGMPLLDLLRADLLKHVGAPLDDDAALLLVRAPAVWPGSRQALRGPARQGQPGAPRAAL